MLTEDSILVRYKTTVLLWKGTRVQRTFSFQLELTDHAVADNSLFVSTSGGILLPPLTECEIVIVCFVT